MVSFNVLVVVSLAYAALLFAVAFWAERQARFGRLQWLRSPIVYTLSLSIYCTAWTFYGAVGNAARSGLEFMTIYLGPTLVMLGWWWLLRRLIRIGRTQRITSIADLLSSRYGNSNMLGALVAVMAVIGTTPYIALQLQSVTLAFGVFAVSSAAPLEPAVEGATALWVAAGLAVFTIMFGTRNLDSNERHDGVVSAIALEAVVKLVALLSVGGFVVWSIAGGPVAMLEQIDASRLASWQAKPDRWLTLMFLSAAAFICLPRMFQVLVVENTDEQHLATASWAFPAYLMLMSIFVVPIAVVGLARLPEGANPDLFVLTLPLAFDADGLAMLSFLGGFSSATSMVIVAAIALSTMISNQVVMPIWLASGGGGASVSGDVRKVLLVSRRLSIAAILALGYLYYRFTGGTEALASIGLIAFTGVAQMMPALLGAIFWRGATRLGAMTGLTVGFAVWAYTMFLPSFGDSFLLSASTLAKGPFGIGWLRPQALFGLVGFDPLVHAVFWSIFLNATGFVIVSLLTFPAPVERLQGAQFVNVFELSAAPGRWSGRMAEAEDLLIMSQRIMGPREAQAFFATAAAGQGRTGYLPDVTPDFMEQIERRLAGSVGAATAHAMVGQIVGGTAVSVEDLLAVANEAAQMLEYSSQLEQKSAELTRATLKLSDANEKLTNLSLQKDAFLSQISHELRTPMTSIRAFSAILRESDALRPDDIHKYSGIIQDESERLTRLLDDLLDLSVLEAGRVTLNLRECDLAEVLAGAVQSAAATQGTPALHIVQDIEPDLPRVRTDPDRLAQVFINLITNARKYCDADAPQLAISLRAAGPALILDFVDNGQGIPEQKQELIFEKFSRLSDQAAAGSAGLGLAICREIMRRLGGSIAYLPGQGGAAFRVVLPIAPKPDGVSDS